LFKNGGENDGGERFIVNLGIGDYRIITHGVGPIIGEGEEFHRKKEAMKGLFAYEKTKRQGKGSAHVEKEKKGFTQRKNNKI